MADFTARTPQEYIEYYTEQLKEDLQQFDIQINKLGLVGYLLNILGWTQYDSKNYADNLFKEAFVATSRDEANLYTHASIYGYVPGFATPATATGNFVFDFSFMPKKPTNIVKREIIFPNLSFTVSGYPFVTNTEYRFIDDDGVYYAIIFDEFGNAQHIPSSSSSISAPFVNVYQVEDDDSELSIQSYDFGTYYPHTISFDEGFISDIEVQVKESTATEYVDYDVKNVKYLENSFSNVVFLRSVEVRKYLLEFGSGVRGNYVPNARAKINLEITHGKSGNLNISETTSAETTGTIIQRQFDTEDVESYISGNVQDILSVEFEYSEGGRDSLRGDDLRSEIISFVQSRDNLISRDDYYNVNQKYEEDFEFIFRKTSFLDNVFYLCRAFRDRLQDPVQATTFVQQLLSDYDVETTLSGSSVYDDDYTLDPGDYDYFVIGTDNFGNTNDSNIVSVQVGEVEETEITCNAGSTLSGGEYFTINTIDDEFYVWYTVNASGTDPAPADKVGVQVNIFSTDINSVVATKTAAQIDAQTGMSASADGAVVTVTNDDRGDVDDAADVDTGFGFSVATQGVDENGVLLTWTAITGAVKYLIYGRDDGSGNYNYWETYNTYFIDTGDDGETAKIITPASETVIFYPTFGANEETEITCNAGSTLSGGEYFTLNSSSTEYYVWYTVDSSGTDPAPTDKTGIQVDILSTDADSDVASKTATEINDNTAFYATSLASVVTISNNVTGEVTDAADNDTGFEIEVTNQGLIEFISPFIYKLNTTMNWYEGNLLFENFIVNFNNIKDRSPDYNIPAFYFNIVYDRFQAKTSIYVKSHQDISSYDFLLDIIGLNITDATLTNVDTNTWVYEYTDTNYGLVWEEISLELTIINSVGTHVLTGQTESFYQVSPVYDTLKLLKYSDYLDNTNVINIGVMNKIVFDADKPYYLDKMYQFLTTSNFEENRLVTDEIQLKFLNTYLVESAFLEYVTEQEYNTFDLELPLVLSVDCYVDEDYLSENTVDINEEKNSLLLALAELLQDQYTGVEICFYNSQIIDFVHTDRPFFKRVTVTVKDSAGTTITDGLETFDLRDVLDRIMADTGIDAGERKLNILKYVPPFWYWDTNNITVRILF